MNEQQIASLAAALGFDIPAPRLTEVASSLQAQIDGGGGMSADELEGVEPALLFGPEWEDPS